MGQWIFPPPSTSAVLSVQVGSIVLAAAASNTATIAAVGSKAALHITGFEINGVAAGGTAQHWFPRLALTNSTTITATRGGNTGNVTVGYCIIDYA